MATWSLWNVEGEAEKFVTYPKCYLYVEEEIDCVLSIRGL